MRITKLPDSQDEKMIAKEKALVGCNVCPCCGETKIACLGEFLHGSVFTLIKRLFVTRYKCHTCGAEWESEPYRK